MVNPSFVQSSEYIFDICNMVHIIKSTFDIRDAHISHGARGGAVG
jgi:hypothetical protein